MSTQKSPASPQALKASFDPNPSVPEQVPVQTKTDSFDFLYHRNEADGVPPTIRRTGHKDAYRLPCRARMRTAAAPEFRFSQGMYFFCEIQLFQYPAKGSISPSSLIAVPEREYKSTPAGIAAYHLKKNEQNILHNSIPDSFVRYTAQVKIFC